MEPSAKDLFDMTFHEVKHCHDDAFDCAIVRVNKGWIYTFFTREIGVNGADQITSSSVFVSE